jgi:hypothetical protein
MKNLISFGGTIGPQAIEAIDEDLDKFGGSKLSKNVNWRWCVKCTKRKILRTPMVGPLLTNV